MILSYIWHDCFWLQTKSANVVFDFWKDPLAPSGAIPDFIKNADKGKALYVLVSHHHKDHYSKRIFEWQKLFADIHYILSEDTARHARHIINPESLYSGPRPENVTIIKPGECYHDENITINAFASTDIGNSYAIELDGKSFFHAGDLNAWIWKDESTDEEVEKSISDFVEILSDIADRYPAIDYAMFPVDSRIGRDYFTGASLFVRKINVRHFFPMHFGLGENPRQQLRFQLDAAKVDLYRNRAYGEYICLQTPYSQFASPEQP